MSFSELNTTKLTTKKQKSWCGAPTLIWSGDCSNDKNTNEGSIRPDWQIQHWHHVLSYEQSLCPWHFRMSLALALETVHSLAHPVNKVHTDAHPMSKAHTFTDLHWWGCLWSPLSIGGAVLPMLMSSVTRNWPQAFCHTGSLKHNTPFVPLWSLGRVLLHQWSSTQLYCSTEFVMAT